MEQISTDFWRENPGVKNSLLKPLGMTKFSTNRKWIYPVISLFGSGVTPEFSSFSITKKFVLSSPAHRRDHDYQFSDVFRRGLCLRRSSECLLIECFAFTKNPAAGRRNGSPYHDCLVGQWNPSTFTFMIITRDIAILVVASRLDFPNPRQLGVTVSPTDF